MREVLQYILIKPKDPLIRAKRKAQIELSNFSNDPRRLRNYWYHYEALAGDLQARGLVLSALNAHHARLRRGLNINHIEAVVDVKAAERPGKIVEVKESARRLQVVVKFKRKGLRTYPG